MAFNQYSSMSNGYGGNGGGEPVSASSNNLGSDIFRFDRVSPEMLNIGLHAGQDIIDKQRARFMPGIEGFWNLLKIYFAVSNSYVVSKLMVVLYPLQNKNWNRTPSNDSYGEGDESTRKWMGPRNDVMAPDLYIPTMSFITYVLLVGLFIGLRNEYASSAQFSPDIIIQAIWKCFMVQICESFALKFGLSLVSFVLPFLDGFSYTGYKYVGLCLAILARLFGSTFAALVALVTSGFYAFFILKSLAAIVPKAPNGGGPPRHLLIVGLAAVEFVVTLFLNWL